MTGVQQKLSLVHCNANICSLHVFSRMVYRVTHLRLSIDLKDVSKMIFGATKRKFYNLFTRFLRIST